MLLIIIGVLIVQNQHIHFVIMITVNIVFLDHLHLTHNLNFGVTKILLIQEILYYIVHVNIGLNVIVANMTLIYVYLVYAMVHGVLIVMETNYVMMMIAKYVLIVPLHQIYDFQNLMLMREKLENVQVKNIYLLANIVTIVMIN